MWVRQKSVIRKRWCMLALWRSLLNVLDLIPLNWLGLMLTPISLYGMCPNTPQIGQGSRLRGLSTFLTTRAKTTANTRPITATTTKLHNAIKRHQSNLRAICKDKRMVHVKSYFMIDHDILKLLKVDWQGQWPSILSQCRDCCKLLHWICEREPEH